MAIYGYNTNNGLRFWQVGPSSDFPRDSDGDESFMWTIAVNPNGTFNHTSGSEKIRGDFYGDVVRNGPEAAGGWMTSPGKNIDLAVFSGVRSP